MSNDIILEGHFYYYIERLVYQKPSLRWAHTRRDILNGDK